MTGATIAGVAIRETNLSLSMLEGVSFRGMMLEDVDFTQADLTLCDFRQTVLSGCQLRDARIDRARFEQADLRHTNLDGLRIDDPARFKGATISPRHAAVFLAHLGLKFA